ncbi:MAG: 4-hydroxy-tetrahydrodipicolinate reductase [Candidatus Omnitrophica bacterium]|nr:4-hydroxy-tetrahydrodipicolinate reductase [Candidatus Omnitrophota bacterium]
MVKICVSGSKGKMGLRIIALAKADKALRVSGAFDIGDDPEPPIKGSQCLIEFTTPQATMEHLMLCEKYKVPMVIGTTGLSDADIARVRQASKKIPVVYSPNMSIGVNLLFNLLEDAARVLDAQYDIKIKEAHHIHKKDAPSGTAKELARIIKDIKGLTEVPIESIREGETVGDHTITFESPLDTIVLHHSAKTRDIFVRGALEAAKFSAKKTRGLFTMRDVLKGPLS